MSLASVAAEGVRLATLQALRDRLAKEIDTSASARDVAALSRQLTDVLLQIEEITAPEEETDELADLIPLPGGASAG